MRTWTWFVAVLMFRPDWLGGPPPAAAQPSATLVVLSNTAAPGGGNYDAFGNPMLNGSGQVAFRADLIGGMSNQGIFVGVPGSIQAAARQNTPAPAGGTYVGFATPVLNESGQVAFRASLTGGPVLSGVFVGAPGSIQAAALSGSPAPTGGNYTTFNPPVLNGTGQVSFRADLTGGSSSQGIFAGAPGAIQAAALQGMGAPGGGIKLPTNGGQSESGVDSEH